MPRLLLGILLVLAAFVGFNAALLLILPPSAAGLLLFIEVVLLVIVAHESGHFFAAKAFGIKVEEFFVGFGPRLWSVRRGETEYGLKALPFGGYVRIAGMNPFQEPPPEDLPRTFGAKPAWQRAVVLAAGSVTHFVLALVILAIFFGAFGLPRARIAQVELLLDGSRSPASAAGLRTGDEVLEVDGRRVDYGEFLTYTRSHVGRDITIVVLRDGERVTLRAAPVLVDVDGQPIGRLGVILTTGGRVRVGPVAAVRRGAGAVGEMSARSVGALGEIFSPSGLSRIGRLLVGDEEREPTDVTGVVGAARLSGQAAQEGAFEALFFLFAGFNVFVGILNLLPLPPLDGGHLAVLAVERVTGRRVDVRRLLPLTAAVAGFLILFMVSLIYLDVVRPLPNPFR